MEKSIDSVRRNFNTVRTGRANTSILDRIQARATPAVHTPKPSRPLRAPVSASRVAVR